MKLLAKIGMLGLFASATASVLYADPAGGWLSPNGPSGGGSFLSADDPTGATTNAQASTGQTGALSQIDVQFRVQILHEQSRADARHIQHLQQMARKEKDVIKLNCVNDKIVQVKPHMNSADRLESELANANDGNRMGLFESMQQAVESVRLLREEADQCIGEPVQFGGDTSNSFTGPNSPDDPNAGAAGPGLEPPTYASPFN